MDMDGNDWYLSKFQNRYNSVTIDEKKIQQIFVGISFDVLGEETKTTESFI